MYPVIQMLHSLLAYVVLVLLTMASINAIIGMINKADFSLRDFKLTLWALIATHTQVVLGWALGHLAQMVPKS
ncbi:MAG: hypothetical protein ACPF82_04930 [Flavobacteriaceae bacterium]